MLLKHLVLQNFRSYSQANFIFSADITVIIGPNTAGKTNLADAIYLLSAGKSSKGSIDSSLIHFGKEIGRIKGQVTQPVIPDSSALSSLPKGLIGDPEEDLDSHLRGNDNDEKTTLEVVLMTPQYNNGRFGKKYLVNDVAKSRTNFLGHLPLVLFRPEELDIIIDGPSVRRNFLNEVLEQVDREYVASLLFYERALRQRNALLGRAKDAASNAVNARNVYNEQFTYWDELIISHGQLLTRQREAFIDWLNAQKKEIIDFSIIYDHSKISSERLLQYKDAETSAGVTLVGPHRDDFYIELPKIQGEKRNVRVFGSRGQQRLVVLQLKLLQIQFMTEKLGEKPLLVLDDIFSELDSAHIQLVLEKIIGMQVIVTTTHKEFIPDAKLKKFTLIELKHQKLS